MRCTAAHISFNVTVLESFGIGVLPIVLLIDVCEVHYCGASNKEKGAPNSLFRPFADRLVMQQY